MLLQYSVENYKSIKDEIIINFAASRRWARRDASWIIERDYLKTPIYKSIGLIGPNASGKSNILESITFALHFINNTIKRKETALIHTTPFAYDKQKKTTRFEFIFFQNKVKYVYGFSVSTEIVTEEYLMAYYSVKPTTLFERDNNKFSFRGNDKKYQTEIAEKTNANRLYMPVAAEWGYQPIKEAYQWFERDEVKYVPAAILLEQIVKESGRREQFISLLKKADFDIDDIVIKNSRSSKQKAEVIERLVREILGEDIPKSAFELPEVWLCHRDRNGRKLDIELSGDSSGTKQFVEDLIFFFHSSIKSLFTIQDELGKSYHTKLTKHYLNFINNREINKGYMQLFFSSHDTNVLNIMNPDQIYLVDKDDDGITHVKLLDDYEIRLKDNIELGYLKGRYGALPLLKV